MENDKTFISTKQKQVGILSAVHEGWLEERQPKHKGEHDNINDCSIESTLRASRTIRVLLLVVYVVAGGTADVIRQGVERGKLSLTGLVQSLKRGLPLRYFRQQLCQKPMENAVFWQAASSFFSANVVINVFQG